MLSNLLSVIFFTSFCVYLLLGFNGFFIDRKSIINRALFILCLSLCVWAFALTVAASAASYDDALFWQRIAAIGRISMFAFLLHFVLCLTGKNRYFKKTWLYVLLYSPAIVLITIFSIINTTAQAQHNLVYTIYGWVNLSYNNFWDWFYNAYYSVYTILSIALIIRWRLRLDKNQKSAANLLGISFFSAFIIGTFTDVILGRYLAESLPEMAPAAIMVPVAAIYYSIKKYNLIKSASPKRSLWSRIRLKEQASAIVEGQALFRSEDDLSIYTNRLTTMIMAAFLFVSSIINFSYFTLFSLQDFSVALRNSLIILFLACCFMAVNLVGNTKLKYRIIIVLFVVIMIFLNVEYYKNIGPAIWTATYIYVMLAMNQTDKTMLTVFAAMIFGLGIFVWIRNENFTLSTTYYVVQFSLFALLFLISSLIFNMNARKNTRIREQIKQLTLISQASENFLTISSQNFNEKVTTLLEQNGKHFGADRSYLFLLAEDMQTINYTKEWCNDGIKPAIDIVGEIPVSATPWLMNQILNGKEVHIPDVEKLTAQAEPETELLKKSGIKSLLSVPVTWNGKTYGFLGLDAVKNLRHWNEDNRKILGVLANTLSDTMSKIAAEKEIYHMAYYDDLTGLPSRRLLLSQLEKEILMAQKSNKLIGIIFFDIDFFKDINDVMGHDSGDELLKQVSRRLSENIEKCDMFSRFGGDEFLLLITNINQPNDIIARAEKIMKSFEQPLLIKGQEFFVTISAGIALYPNDGKEPYTLIKNADLAMYSSKRQGKNQYTLCSPVLKEDLLLKTKLTNSLYRAQQSGELQLYYQPQICISTKKIIGVEALLRWNHPKMGMVMPNLFIPLAEQTGLINSIGEWVLRTACSRCAAWHKLGLPAIRMAVNLSLLQIQNPKIVSSLQRILRETGLDSQYLELEITESIASRSTENVIRVLNELKELGTTISIDDFGVEYSSLNRLKRMPIDRIKIDMQFIHSIAQSDKDNAIVKIIVLLGKSLGLKVIAEGVETEQQLDFLTNHLCDEVQGFYFYKPMPAHEVEKILLDQQIMK